MKQSVKHCDVSGEYLHYHLSASFAHNVAFLLNPNFTLCFLMACPCAGCHDPRHANLQSHDAIWLRPDTPARPEHQQFVYTGGTAEATTAATATTGTAGKHRYNTHLSSSSPSFHSIMRRDQILISLELVSSPSYLEKNI